MQLDERAYNFIQKAKAAGYTKDQVADYLQKKGYEFTYTPSQADESTSNKQEDSSPGLVEGTVKQAANAFAFGQGSRLAGLANTSIVRALSALTPYGAYQLYKSDKPLDFSDFSEAYKEGKEQFEKEQQSFSEKHPVANTIGEVAGTLGGIAVPAGAAGKVVQGGVAATRLGRAGKAGQLAARIAGEATAFGTYEGIREGFGEGRADAMAALAGAGKGAALGGALGILGGAVEAAEPTLVNKAIELGMSPTKSKILVKALGIGAEGTTLGALPPIFEGELPTAKDVAGGLAFAAGGRAVSEGISSGLGAARKWLTEPSAREIQIQKGKGLLEDLNIKKENLQRIEAKEQTARNELKTLETSLNKKRGGTLAGRPIEEIQADLDKYTREQRLAGQADKELAELEPHLNKAETEVNSFMAENGWDILPKYDSKEDTSRYLKFKKGKKEITVRISAHEPSAIEGNLQYDLRKAEIDNLKSIGQSIVDNKKIEKLSSDLEKARERATSSEAKLKEFVGEDSELLRDIVGDSEVIGRITPTETQIAQYMKRDKTLTREKAIDLLKYNNTVAAIKKKQGTKTFRQKARDFVEKIRTEFNLVRPIEKIEEDWSRVSGKKIDFDKRASVSLYKLANEGEWNALSQPVVKKLQEALKTSPKAMEKYGRYAQAKKDIQLKRSHGEQPSKENLDIVELYKNDKEVLDIDNSVKELNQTILKNLYDTGRIDKATYKKWKANEDYVPSKAVLDTIENDPLISRELSDFTRKYEGTGIAYENAFISSLVQGKSLYRFSELNKAKQKFITMAKDIGEARLVKPNVDYTGGKVKFDTKNQIVVWSGGKPQVWEVPEKVARFFNPEKAEPAGAMLKTLGAFMRLYKGGTTATSLGFSYSNIVRDVQSAVMGSKYGGYIGASTIKDSMKELYENTPLAQFFRKEQGGKTLLMTEQLPGLAKDSIKEAQETLSAIEKSFPDGSQRNLLARMFTQTVPEYAKRLGRVSSKSFNKTLEGLSYAGQLGEETTRFSVFKSVLEAKAENKAQLDLWFREPNKIPKNVLAEAGNEAREVTLNFNKKMAPWVEKANRYFLPYFKPSILGSMRGFEVLSNPEIAPRAWRYIINLGVLQGLINGRIGSKEELEKYEAVNNDITGKTFVLQGKDGKIYSLPLSQEFGPLTKIFSLATEKIYRTFSKQAREDIGREALSAAKQETENLIPVAGYLTNPSNLTIQPFKLPIELKINKDLYSGTPIEPEYLKELPPSMRYNQNTSRTLVKMAEFASKLGVEISPMQMQHIVKGTVSSTGKEALALSDTVLATMLSTDLRPSQEMENNPLIRRFVADLYAPYNQYSIDARKIIEDNKQGFSALEKGKIDPKTVRGNKYKEQYYVYSSIKGMADDLNKLYRDRKQLLESLRMRGEHNRINYEQGKLTKEKMLYENDKAMKQAEGALTLYKDYQRRLELAIIAQYKKAKKQYRTNK